MNTTKVEQEEFAGNMDTKLNTELINAKSLNGTKETI